MYAKLYKTEFIKNCNYIPIIDGMGEDRAFNMSFFSCTNKINICPYFIYVYDNDNSNFCIKDIPYSRKIEEKNNLIHSINFIYNNKLLIPNKKKLFFNTIFKFAYITFTNYPELI
jgi:hypothetical protein